MGFIDDFLSSDAYFPVLIGLMLALVLVFVYILLSGKKKIKKQDKEEVPVEVPNNIQYTIDPATGLAVPVVASNTVVAEQPTEVVETPILKEETELPIEEVVVDLPINNMDETPVDLPEENNEMNDVGEAIEIEHTNPLVEENVPSDEIVDIDIPLPKAATQEESGEEVELPEEKVLVEEKGEEVEIPEPQAIINDQGEEAVAFDTIPEANHFINEKVHIEAPREYVGEKTEVFDLGEFNGVQTETSSVTAPINN